MCALITYAIAIHCFTAENIQTELILTFREKVLRTKTLRNRLTSRETSKALVSSNKEDNNEKQREIKLYLLFQCSFSLNRQICEDKIFAIQIEIKFDIF